MINRCLTQAVGPIQLAADNTTQTTVSVDNSSTAILAAGSYKYVMVQNRGATAVYITIDGDAATTASGFEILPGAFYEFAAATPSAGIKGIRSSATENVIVAYTTA